MKQKNLYFYKNIFFFKGVILYTQNVPAGTCHTSAKHAVG